MSQQIKDELKTARTISSIGALIGILTGFGLMYLVSFIDGALGLAITMVGFGVWCIMCSYIVASSVGKLRANPIEHAKRGKRILVFSILGLGTIIAAVGGVMAIRYKPTKNPLQPFVPPSGRVTPEMEMLSNGERIINSAAASWGPVGRAHIGQLTLTSKRIIFEGFKGRFSSQTETLVNLPLTEIENVTVEGRFQKYITVAIKDSATYGLPAQLSFLVNNAPQWKEQIIEQSSVTMTDQQIDNSTTYVSTPTAQPTLTAEDTTTQLPQPVITRICPQCGHVLDEEDKFCAYCGRHLE